MPTFRLTPLPELHLDRAPLAKVLMQIQYSRTPQLVTGDAEAAIAQALPRYPVRRRQVTAGPFPDVVINGQPLPVPPNLTPGVALAFLDQPGHWQATVTDSFVSLETSTYDTRADFCDRVEQVLRAVAAVATPPVVDRVGVRYIDRLVGSAVNQVPSFVLPELSALAGCIEPPLRLLHSVTESQVEIGAGEQLLARTGLLPPGGAFDPALPSVPEPSWLLDMDVFTTQAGFEFDPTALTDRVRRYAEVAYAFFRFATTDAMQEAHRTDLVDGEEAVR